MVDDVAPESSEAGTTLAELLVVIVLLGVVGALTTTGIVRGFNAQLDATNVAETLDGMRLATQRVRDFVREADEVCASSTNNQLVLWTDDNSDGAVQNVEKDIFELDDTVDPPVFQRRVPALGETQIIRDDILNGAIFIYDGDLSRSATEQPGSLLCTDGESVAGGVSRVRAVQVAFTVDHPDPAQPDLTTSTTVRIRNADLVEKPNSAPTGSFTFDCPVGSQTCTFDATGSTDPDGSIVSYAWDFADGNGGTGATVSHTFDRGDEDYRVTLLVVDDEGAADTVQEVVRPGLTSGNPRPVAAFTTSCINLICTFDAGDSSDDGTIVEYRWDLGGTGTATEADERLENHAFPAPGTYAVTLEVVDDDGAVSDPLTRSILVGDVIFVGALRADRTDKTNTYDVDLSIDIETTSAAPAPSGITVSVQLFGGKVRTDSCSTDAAGTCTISVKSIKNTDLQSLEVTNLTDSGSTYVYDPNQDVVDEIVIGQTGQPTRYRDGEEVTP